MPGPVGHKRPLDGFTVEYEAPLHPHTSFRVGGPAQILAAPGSAGELAALLKAAGKESIPVTILGGGTNVLVSDAGIRGLTLLLTGLKETPELIDQGSVTLLRARAGQPLFTLCRLAADKGLSGLEWAAGIPGTLGGAVAMNAGSFGSEMAVVTQALEVLDMKTLEIRTLPRKELRFTYRGLLLESLVVLGADLALLPADPEEVRRVTTENLKRKNSTQPVSRASAGCFFKNPSPENPAGRLIDQAGLKGFVYKGAMVSDLHANFIINHNHATCGDILALADLVTARVREKFNVTLEKEVKLIGS